MMKRLFACIALLGWVASSRAATLPTNYYENITLHLAAVAPGKALSSGLGFTTSNLTLTTAKMLEIIGHMTTNQFSAKAKLLEVFPIGYSTNNLFGYLVGNPRFVVRDGATDTDITALTTVTTVNSNLFVTSYNLNKQNAYLSYNTFRIRTITFSNSVQTFSGQGFVESTLHNVTIPPKTVIFGANDHWSSLNGVAAGMLVNGVLQGTLAANYDHVE